MKALRILVATRRPRRGGQREQIGEDEQNEDQEESAHVLQIASRGASGCAARRGQGSGDIPWCRSLRGLKNGLFLILFILILIFIPRFCEDEDEDEDEDEEDENDSLTGF